MPHFRAGLYKFNFVESRSTRKIRTPSIAAGVQLQPNVVLAGMLLASVLFFFALLRCGKHHTTRIAGVQGAFVLSQGECHVCFSSATCVCI